MRSYRCFRCGRELSNERSVEAGIGPICRRRVAAEDAAEDRQRKANLTCHQGFACYAPDHVQVTLGRFRHRFDALADQTGLPAELRADVQTQLAEAISALGLDRPHVEVPEVNVPMFGRETIDVLGIPPSPAPGGGVSYRMPVDHDEQYRRISLRIDRVCPFGLDCSDPRQAEQAIWRLLSIMRYEVEPLLATEDNCGWAWDRSLYQHLSNSLECLGSDEDARDIDRIVNEQHARPVRLMFTLS